MMYASLMKHSAITLSIAINLGIHQGRFVVIFAPIIRLGALWGHLGAVLAPPGAILKPS